MTSEKETPSPEFGQPPTYDQSSSQQQQQSIQQQQQPIFQQPTVLQQASAHNTTVVVNQQTAIRTQRAWTQSLCGCFDDCGICVCVTFCGPCAACQLAQDMGEFLCLACCVPNWMVAARTKVRTQLGIQGSICDDCCVTTCCSACAMCQLWREVKVARYNGQM